MVDIFQTISSFFVAVSTSVLVFIGVQANEPVQQLEVMGAEEVVITPSPSPSPSPDIIPSPLPSPTPKIICTGPDGGQFEATQEECDEFNNAWKDEEPPNIGEVKKNKQHNCNDEEIKKLDKFNEEPKNDSDMGDAEFLQYISRLNAKCNNYLEK